MYCYRTVCVQYVLLLYDGNIPTQLPVVEIARRLLRYLDAYD